MLNAKRTASSNNAHAPRIQTTSVAFFLLAAALFVWATITLELVVRENNSVQESHGRYEECTAAANNLMSVSDYLTTSARMYVVTGQPSNLQDYLSEIDVNRNRDKDVDVIGAHLEDAQAHKCLSLALDESNRLAERELYALRLVADATQLDPLPTHLRQIELKSTDAKLTPEAQQKLAQEMMFDKEYQRIKNRIIKNVDECTEALVTELAMEENLGETRLDALLARLRIVVFLLMALVALSTLANQILVIKPLRVHERCIRDNEPLETLGAHELRNVAESYNAIYEENHRRTMLLKHEAETDALTGLLNRGSFDRLLKHHGEDIALILIDVDNFKSINDTYGHDTGDLVLKKVAASISDSFRTTDYACRIGGDEFAAIMTEMGDVGHDVITGKLNNIAANLRDESDNLPCTTISVGVAYSENVERQDNLYRAADKALYDAKRHGRNRCSFFDDLER